MESTVSLYNLALARLGGDQTPLNISSIEDDAVGVLCKNLFPHVLSLSLARYDWSFARKRVALAELPGQRPENELYAYAYRIPADCLRPLRLDGYGGINRAPEYVIEGNAILTNVEQAVLLYSANVTDPRVWPPEFSDALAWMLAGEISSARLNDPQKQQMCWQAYQTSIANAIALDQARQNAPQPVSAWNAVRTGLPQASRGRY
jgi:hypothetical protein